MPVPPWQIQYYAHDGRAVESSDIIMQWLPRQMGSARHHDFVSEARYGLAGALGGALLGEAATVSPPILTDRHARRQEQSARNDSRPGAQKSSSG